MSEAGIPEEYNRSVTEILNDCALTESEYEPREGESILPSTKPLYFEDTLLFQLISKPTKENLRNAILVLDGMEEHEINLCADDGSTFLHHLVKVTPHIYKVSSQFEEQILTYHFITAIICFSDK